MLRDSGVQGHPHLHKCLKEPWLFDNLSRDCQKKVKRKENPQNVL